MAYGLSARPPCTRDHESVEKTCESISSLQPKRSEQGLGAASLRHVPGTRGRRLGTEPGTFSPTAAERQPRPWRGGPHGGRGGGWLRRRLRLRANPAPPSGGDAGSAVGSLTDFRVAVTTRTSWVISRSVVEMLCSRDLKHGLNDYLGREG